MSSYVDMSCQSTSTSKMGTSQEPSVYLKPTNIYQEIYTTSTPKVNSQSTSAKLERTNFSSEKKMQLTEGKNSRLILTVILMSVIAATAIIIAVNSTVQCSQNQQTDTDDFCDSNPCENNGTCVSGNDDYACKCQDGYYGNNCAKRNNLCDSNPCENNGTCVSGNDDYSCKCQDGYYGNNCTKRNNLCDSNPCENNATCVSGNDDYACKCQDGYYGNNCAKRTSHIPGWFAPGNCFQYKLTDASDTWNASRAACQAMGGDLAVDGMKNLATRRLIARNLDVNEEAWIGVSDLATEGTFIWVDGSVSTPNNTHWYPGEPNNYYGRGNEDCGGIWKSFNYLTNDGVCSDRFQALCEKRLY